MNVDFRGHNTKFACCYRTGFSLSSHSHESDAIWDWRQGLASGFILLILLGVKSLGF